MAQSILMAALMVAATGLTVAGVLFIAAAIDRRRELGRRAAAQLGKNRLDAVFLFEDGTLIDANERAEALLRRLDTDAQPWPRLRRFLQAGLPDIDTVLDNLPETGSRILAAGDGSGMTLRAEWLSGSMRLTVSDNAADDGGVLLDRLSLRAMEDELTLLRRVSEMMPAITWREDAQKRVIWANQAYLRHLATMHGGDGGDGGDDRVIPWPLPALFAAGAPGSTMRATLAIGPGQRESWFDVMRVSDGEGQLAFALPADSAHRAEKTRQAFVQTLTKTFATLPTGLAVFDRARRLQLFNPALADLTGLEPEFLTSRPGLEGFLNRLREKRILPEPRDYRSWSRRLLEIEKGAETSDFEETWLLPTGQTYRVSASPHPDGALAFLIEDFTSEVHMSRHIRAELENCRNALDLLDEAIALFSQEGQLVHANTAFSRLWAFEGEEAIGGVSLASALENWREASADPGLWNRIAGIAGRGQAGMSASGEMLLNDGESLHVNARRAGSGLLMIGFRQAMPGRAAGSGADGDGKADIAAERSDRQAQGAAGHVARARRRAQVVRASA